MADDSEGPKDLLGDPWTPPRDPRGRKRHRRVPQLAEMIAVLRATGSTVDQIVKRVGLSEPTLRKYYLRELDGGSDLARQVLISSMWAKALAGNVAAARFIREEFPKGDAEAFLRQARANPNAPPATTKVGKKDAANQAAATAGEDSEWGSDLKFPVSH